MDEFDQAREAFKQMDYERALQLVNSSLKEMPNDAVLHEFRGLILFAMGDYDQAAGVIYAVLSAGPGWDWTTLSGLYADPATYTAQLRKLEEYRNSHPDSANVRFLLAYEYITCGHNEAAVKELKKVVELNPDDQLSAQLLAGMTEGSDGEDPPAEVEPPPSKPQPEGATVDGKWQAARGDDRFDLDLAKDGKFTWVYTSQGKTDKFSGTYTAGNGILTLVPSDGGGAMVGDMSWDGPEGFNFRMTGGAPNDPGLNFKK
ncbi:Tetratricopeptide repeat protein [Symmachiella macrocystis]|uniref:Tetratricopeptide repeat protein n=1 Tax=Symmachiella macrocystis TaxID=2527985 RepID=A0A5C6BUF9_9PLAN|nr:tetratricopeptide repeat protein [Symmachiella macrocystis]TWU14379.1 Tetratricopeptide repeat protein [Symmachiella macrocystis]